MAAILHLPPDEPAPFRPRLVVVRAHRRDAAVYRRRRLAVLLAFLAVALVAALVLGQARAAHVTAPVSTAEAPGAAPLAHSAPPAVYVVQPGDTLWTIARKLHPGGDVRGFVDALADGNGGAAVTVGQRLRLPDN